jgi:hypothetical protein
MDRKIRGKRRGETRYKQILDDLKERTSYWDVQEKH